MDPTSDIAGDEYLGCNLWWRMIMRRRMVNGVATQVLRVEVKHWMETSR